MSLIEAISNRMTNKIRNKTSCGRNDHNSGGSPIML